MFCSRPTSIHHTYLCPANWAKTKSNQIDIIRAYFSFSRLSSPHVTLTGKCTLSFTLSHDHWPLSEKNKKRMKNGVIVELTVRFEFFVAETIQTERLIA